MLGGGYLNAKGPRCAVLALENNRLLIQCCLFSIQTAGKTTFRWKTLILWRVVACREVDTEERVQQAESQKYVYSWALLQDCSRAGGSSS